MAVAAMFVSMHIKMARPGHNVKKKPEKNRITLRRDSKEGRNSMGKNIRSGRLRRIGLQINFKISSAKRIRHRL